MVIWRRAGLVQNWPSVQNCSGEELTQCRTGLVKSLSGTELFW